MTAVPIARYFNPTVLVSMLGIDVLFANGDGLNIRFDVTRSMAATPDACVISIEGLDPNRARTMGAAFASLGVASVSISAGYDETRIGMFSGTVRTFKPNQQTGPQLWTTIAADDGGDAFSDVPLRISNAGMTAQQMIEVAAAAMGLVVHPSVATVIGQSDPSKQGPYTAVFTGKASDLIDAAARRIRARWWIRDGQILLGFRGQPDQSRPAVALPPEALVVEPIERGSGLKEFTSFLDPNMVPGSQVVLQGSTLRVESVRHSGETRRGLLVSQVIGRTL